jgi:pyruvyltransferase
LIPYLFPEFGSYDADKADLEQCMIFHFYDDTLPYEGDTVDLGEGKLPVVQPWPTMVGNITRCKRLISSSLHGVIIADAFGVPVQWLRRQSAVQPGKFYDYFESFPHEHWNSSINGKEIVGTLNDTSNLPKPMEAADRSEYARKILESFPFHLFTTAAAQVEKKNTTAHKEEDLVGELLDLQSQRLRDAAPLFSSLK